MKMLITIALLFFSATSFAQEKNGHDGHWMKRCIEASDRVNVTRNGTIDDLAESMALVHYLGGMLAVHRRLPSIGLSCPAIVKTSPADP